jgi:hypothetical protein
MPIVPLFGLGQKGKSPVVTSQRHLNLYAEITQEAEKSSVSYYGTPGTELFYSFGDTPVRGSIAVGDFKYDVHRGTFWEVNNAGVQVNRGTLSTTSGRVDIVSNGVQIAIVDGTNMYCYTIATNAFVTVSSGLFANPATITFQDGYGIASFANSGQFQISALYDFTTWGALDFATAESNPDSLVRVIADHGEVILAGSDTVEFWGNSGGQDFPYSNMRGATLEFGLAARWSLVKYNDSLAGLFKNRMGQVQVMVLVGHAIKPISSLEHSYLINQYATVSDATAFSYMLGGHPMLQINFPSAGKSWLYDAMTNLWTELESGLSGGRHIAEIQCDFLNKTRVSDYSNGNVYTLSADVYTDNGALIPREIITRHTLSNYNRLFIHRLQVDIETGVGTVSGQGSNPQIMLQVSKNNGRKWGVERWTTMGKIGAYLTRALWLRLGMSRDWLFKFRITDPVKVVITGGSIDADAGR